MLVALPSALAFGVAIYAPLGAEFTARGAMAGLLGAAAIGVIAPLFGGAPRLISAPCAPAAAVMAALAGQLTAGAHGAPVAPEQAVLLMTVAAAASAGLQLLYSTAGGGKLIKFIPYPVVTGYLSGVAVLICLAQAPKLLVLPKGVAALQGLLSPDLWSVPGLLIGLAAVLGMAGAPTLTERVPAPIVGLAAGLGAYAALAYLDPALRLLDHNPLVVGPLPAGGGGAGPLLAWSGWARLDREALARVMVPAATLSVLLSIDTLKTCVVVDTLTRSRHDSDRELRGQGLANLASAALGGVPGAGTMGATLVNLNAGGRTRLSGALAGAFALAAFLLAKPLIAWVPIPALAGILIVVAWRMFDRKSLKLLRKRSTLFDFTVSATVILVAVAVDLIAAAGAGLALAILLFIRDLAKGTVIHRKLAGNQISSRQRRLPAEREALKTLAAQTVLCELKGNLFFGTTDQLYTELDEDLKLRRFVILDLKRVQSVDFTAVHILKVIEDRLHDKKGRLLLCNLPLSLPSGQDLESYFAEVGLVKPQRFVSLFPDLDAALEWSEDRLLEEAGLLAPHSPVPLELGDIHLLRDLDKETVDSLRPYFRETAYEAGQKVFSRGDSGDEVCLIRKGQVRILLPIDGKRAHHIATFGRSDFFGEVSFLDRGARTADAVAITPTMAYVLSRARLDELSRSRPDIGAVLFARLARELALRLRQADEELRALQEA